MRAKSTLAGASERTTATARIVQIADRRSRFAPLFFLESPARALCAVYVRRLQSLGTLRDLELDALALFERAESCSIDGAIMDEHFLPVLHRDEAVALLRAEPRSEERRVGK